MQLRLKETIAYNIALYFSALETANLPKHWKNANGVDNDSSVTHKRKRQKDDYGIIFSVF